MLSQVLPHLPLDADPEAISVFEMKIRPCTDCRACYQGDCPLNGDGMGWLLERFAWADLLITAMPIYFSGTPSPLKSILDRSQQLFVKKFVQRQEVFSAPKAGILLTTAGSDDKKNNGEDVMNGAYAVRSGSASQGVRDSVRMFYGCLGATLLGHIAVSGTDRDPDFVINPKEIESLAARLMEFRSQIA